MTVYDALGVRRVINCMGAVTFLGGATLSERVIDAMAAASRMKVNLSELNEAVGRRLADICGAEAGCVTSGAAGGLQLAAAACITRGDISKIARLPSVGGEPHEIVLHRKHRCNFDHALRTTGARLVEFGYSRDRTETWELEAALSDETVAVFYVTDFGMPSVLSLPEVIEVAHAHDVAVIVDAALSLPPRSNLRDIPATGADLCCFSGGKAIGGPQNSGFVVGRADLVAACVRNANPNHNTIGRPSKVNAEAMVGLLVALEEYLARTDAEDYAAFLAVCEQVQSTGRLSAEESCLTAAGKNGMLVPTLRVHIAGGPPRAAAAVEALMCREPAIWVTADGDELIVDPLALDLLDAPIVGTALREVIDTVGIR